MGNCLPHRPVCEKRATGRKPRGRGSGGGTPGRPPGACWEGCGPTRGFLVCSPRRSLSFMIHGAATTADGAVSRAKMSI